MAGATTFLLVIYLLVIFFVLVFSFQDKNPKSHAWYALFDLVNVLLALAFLFFRNKSEDLGTAILGTCLAFGIIILSVIARVIHVVKSSKRPKMRFEKTKAYHVLLLCLLPLAVVGLGRIGDDVSLAGADLILIGKNYNGWVESSRTNLIVKGDECTENRDKLSLSSDWKKTHGDRWEVGEDGSFSKSKYSRGYGSQPSENEVNTMRAIINDIGKQIKEIEHVEETNYYIAGSYIYRGSQRVCKIMSYNDIYYR